MSTGIDLLVGMVLMGCVDHEPFPVSEDKTIMATYYECPLIGNDASFVVLRKVCSKEESHAVTFRDQRTGRGYYIDQFANMQPAFVRVEGNEAYTPHCETSDPK